ncbi:hypothetical protein [Mariniflexile fucanivorans]|uniref:hypothetical protein n=1 Tax=Mariniflexile fucanivorans TaxID=264023 RepID=UPI001042C646|nr:hypothetical protein [Mariniflexile fucanivorans]
MFFLISLSFYAQNAISESIANCTNGEVPLLFSDYISHEKNYNGNYSINGHITIPLDDNFFPTSK